MIALAGVLCLLQAPLDSGVFVVRQDTVEIARESFRLLAGRAGGFTLTATTRYDRGRPVVVLTPVIEFTADSQFATLQYDIADPREPLRILGQLGRGRVTLRYLAHAIERAREFPAGAATVGGATTLTLRARRRDFDPSAAAALLEAVARQLSPGSPGPSGTW